MTTPSDGGDLVIMKSDLRHLHDREYTWPTDVSADKIPPFPKNIAKNFMRGFFQQAGYALTVEEEHRLFHQVFFSFGLCLLFMTHCCSLPNYTLFIFVQQRSQSAGAGPSVTKSTDPVTTTSQEAPGTTSAAAPTETSADLGHRGEV